MVSDDSSLRDSLLSTNKEDEEQAAPEEKDRPTNDEGVPTTK